MRRIFPCGAVYWLKVEFLIYFASTPVPNEEPSVPLFPSTGTSWNITLRPQSNHFLVTLSYKEPLKNNHTNDVHYSRQVWFRTAIVVQDVYIDQRCLKVGPN